MLQKHAYYKIMFNAIISDNSKHRLSWERTIIQKINPVFPHRIGPRLNNEADICSQKNFHICHLEKNGSNRLYVKLDEVIFRSILK